MDDLEFKKKIIAVLKERQRDLKEYRASMTEAFIRGFIVGAEAMVDINIPSHWYEEIINEVKV